MSYDIATLEAAGKGSDSHSFAARVCLPRLLESQNSDGGWGYTKLLASRTEPTAWAVLAGEKTDSSEGRNAAQRGRDWLRRAQRDDGLWPQHPGMDGGTWVTAAACLALVGGSEYAAAVERGAAALCGLEPREKGIGWKIRNLFQRRRHVEQDFSVTGWSWTPGTVSWVIPTSLALIALRNLPAALRPRGASERIAPAEAMLLDRACPGGGWNCGNPMVYGVAGDALHEPTAWALLALRHLGERPEIARALAWIEATRNATFGASSLALASFCLESYGRSQDELAEFASRIESSWHETEFLGSITSLALAILALTPGEDVLRHQASEAVR